MNCIHLLKRFRLITALVLSAILVGCTSVNFDRSISQTNENIPGFTQGNLELALTQEQQTSRRQSAQELLLSPLDQGGAVQLALLNSPAMQVLLADNWSLAARAAQTGRLSNPVFMFAEYFALVFVWSRHCFTSERRHFILLSPCFDFYPR